ncbi:response regulator [Ramlibacter paludis]|uniref:response regulator n=1 Tax=Ramlibacter paludis TaxID=2908000 RepID=UPI0023DAECAD|nr:response regulator [Ramlibacter paludis]
MARKRILLVDDDQAVLVYLGAKLARHYDIVSTLDPYQAITLARSDRPDLILCDLDMPGMSGGDVASALHADPDTARIPLMYLTSLVSPDGVRDLQGQVRGRPGASKRAPLSELVARIEELTGDRAS